MTVYIDVLIFDNMLLNCAILFSVSGYLKIKRNKLFYILSALIGTIYSVVMALAPTESAVNFWVFKMLLSVVMVFVAFYPKNIKLFLKQLLCFYIVSFIFAGLAIAVILLWGQTPTTYNGVMYFTWSSPIKYLLVVAVLGGYLVKLFTNIIHKKKLSQVQIVDLNICINDENCIVPALVDTGNELKDPLTGDPVAVVEICAVEKILPGDFVETVKGGGGCMWDNIPPFSVDMAGRFRLVPFKSLGCEHGMLPGVKSDYVQIRKADTTEPEKIKNVIICFHVNDLSQDGSYRALIGTDLGIYV